MDGIVSLLPQPFYQQVEELWDELEEKFGLTGIRVTPYPHFSWEIADHYHQPGLELVLKTIAQRTKPFTVTTTGLGVFSGEQPVIFIPVVKSPELSAFHQQVWKALLSVGEGISDLYSPRQWLPHISLAYMDVNGENIGAIMQALAMRTYNWQFQVDNFVHIYEPDGSVGKIKTQVQFSGNECNTD